MKKILSLLLLCLLVLVGGCTTKTTSNQIEITFKSQDEVVSVIQIDRGYIVTAPEITLDGYTLAGWYYDLAYSQPYEETDIFEASTTLYAKWEAITYEIRFYTYGGTTISNVKVNHNEKLTRPNDPEKNGYNFKGWYLDKDYTSAYDFSKPVTSKFDLHAKWEEIPLPLVDLDEYEVKYIVTSPGEDSSTTFLINYHTKNIKTKVEWTTADDVNFTNAKIANPEMRGFEMLSNMEKPFERRNVCRVTLTNLTPNTDYIYRVNKGDNTYSDTYHFSTSGNNDTTSFLFMTDIHYWDGGDGAEVSEKVINGALALQPNLDFLLTTGDIIDTGGNCDDWDKLFTKAQSFKTLPFVNVPGNHEHYQIGPTQGAMGNKVFTAYYYYPQNGIDAFKGASYYFIHNDTLFIQIDTDSPGMQNNQLTWLEEVIKNNPAKFVIIGIHAPVNESGTDYNRPFMNILEKYGVDLVLAGHYHNESFKTLYLDKKPENNLIGVTYLRGAGGGIKSIGSADPEEFAKGYLIDILTDRIQIRYLNGRGEVLETREVINKKLHDKEEATKQELSDSVKVNFDTDKQTAKFTWSSKFFKNVTQMILQEEYRDRRKMEFIFPTPGYVSYTFDSMIPSYDNKYTVKITFADGSEEILTFVYERPNRMGLVSDNLTDSSIEITIDPPSEADRDIIRRYEIFLNDKKFATFDAKDFDTGNFNTTFKLEGLDSKTDYHLEIIANGRYGVLYADELNFTTK